MQKNRRLREVIEGEKVSINPKKKVFFETYEEALKAAVTEGMNDAARSLKNRLKTRFEIEQKLLDKGYLEYEITLVIDELIKHKLIDDRRFTKFFLESYQKTRPYGVFALRQKLGAKGVERSIIDEEIDKYYGDEDNDAADEAIDLIKKRYSTYARLKKMDKIQKIDRYLFNRGFEYDVTEKVLSRLEDEGLMDDPEEEE